LFDETQPKPWGAFFTHLEDDWEEMFDEVASKVDYAVCINQKIKTYLELLGVKRVELIRHGHDPRVKKEITFGVCGKVYLSGRKGEYLVKNMVDEGYKVLGLGSGWPCEMLGDWDKAPEFYKKIDYLVITSLNEGGPVPVLDAIAAGVPVIGPNTGWIWEFPCIHYKKGDWDSLNEVLHKLTHPPTWEKDWRLGHRNLFASFSGKSKPAEPS